MSAANKQEKLKITLRGVAQLGARDVWDVEVAGSIPVTPTINRKRLIFNMQVSYIGNTPAFQAGKVGSIPTTCSIYKQYVCVKYAFLAQLDRATPF